jgi:hypothetical protein
MSARDGGVLGLPDQIFHMMAAPRHFAPQRNDVMLNPVEDIERIIEHESYAHLP